MVDDLQIVLGCVATVIPTKIPLSSSCREGEDADKIVARHIQLLHQYNEAKDATQVYLLSFPWFVH
jgi:hypothetical protein